MQKNVLLTWSRLAGLFLLVAWPLGASAMDCAKARTPVERVICADPGLKADDDRLSKLFFAQLDRAKAMAELTGSGHLQASLLDGQRAFIAARERNCATATADVIKGCIAKETAAQATRLGTIFWVPSEAEVEAEASQDYRLGGETITIAPGSSTAEQKLLRHGSSELLSAQDFYFRDFWKDAAVTAILVETYSGGTLQCRSIDIVAMRKQGSVTATELGDGCGYGPSWRAQKTDGGFAFETVAEPLADGSVAEWNAATGIVTKHTTKFAPERGLTMESLLRERPQYREPLSTAEFYTAVQSLPDPDKAMISRALWRFGDACGSCKTEDRIYLYGAQIEPDLVAYSGCGWYLNDYGLNCSGDTDVLAVWDRAARKAYFAIDDHITSGLHSQSNKVRMYPSIKDWPPRALAKLEAWKNGAVWDQSLKDECVAAQLCH